MALRSRAYKILCHQYRRLIARQHKPRATSSERTGASCSWNGLEPLEARVLLSGSGLAALENYAAFGGTSLTVDQNIVVTDGFLGSNGDLTAGSATTTKGLAAGISLFVDSDSSIAGPILAGGIATLNSNVSLTGDIDADAAVLVGAGSTVDGSITSSDAVTLESLVTVTGTVTQFGTPLPFTAIALPAASVIVTDPANDINTAQNSTTTLAPGSYGDLILGKGSALNLSAGEYHFDLISAADNVLLSYDASAGEVAVFVAGNATFGGNVQASLTGGVVEDLYFETQGVFSTGNNPVWVGSVYAPAGSVTIGKNFDITGGVYGGTTVFFDNAGTLTLAFANRLLDSDPPVITAGLTNDTGPDPLDGITSDPAISGTISDSSPLSEVLLSVTGASGGVAGGPYDVTADVNPVDGSFSFNRADLELLLGQVLVDDQYTIDLQATDQFLNTSNLSFGFTLDAQSPSVVDAPQGTFVATFNSFAVRYSEDLGAAALDPANYSMEDSSSSALSIDSITQDLLNPRIVHVGFADDLADDSYTLTLGAGLTDTAGNALTGTTVFGFAISDPVGITSISPADGESMVNVNRETIVRFEDAVDPATVTTSAIQIIANGAQVSGTIIVSSTERFATFYYDQPLSAATEVRVLVDGNLIMGRDGLLVDADGDEVPGGIATADFSTLPLTSIPGTSVSGQVLDAHRTVDPESLPIAVPTGDPYFDPMSTGTETIPFTRANYVGSTGTDVSNPRRHPTFVTSFLDASMVYGSDPARAEALRTLDGTGRLKVDVGDLLPLNNLTNFPEGMLEVDNQGPFDDSTMFVAGDIRATENPALVGLHTVLLREHNRYATDLKLANPALLDEQLYQASRKWVSAIIQQITYNEFLPAMLGSDPLTAYTGYNVNVDPSISAVFSGAAFRIGHSMQASEVLRLDDTGTSLPGGPLSLANSFFNSQPILDDGIEPYLLGLIDQQANEVDTQVIDDMRNFLFGPPGAGGLDLAAINIQRGRDLGLPSYNQARADFGLPLVTSFSQITSDPTLAGMLQSIYGSVDEVDLWVGGLAEDHVSGGTVGELFAAIVADQFQRSRDGDRFWFENGQFTQTDLDDIHATTLADLILRNTSITSVSGNVFTATTLNPGPAPAGSAAVTVPTELRRIDGVGNNLNDPSLGRAGGMLLQNHTLDYGDGVSTPAGASRPGVREVSNGLFDQVTTQTNAASLTSMFLSWGQFIAHDIAKTPSQSAKPTVVPVAGATLTVEGFPTLTATTDATGFFILDDLPAPEVFVFIDGSTATNAPAGGNYTYVAKPFQTVPGQAIPLSKNGKGFDIYLPVVPSDAAQTLSMTETTQVTFQPSAMAVAEEILPGVDPAVLASFEVTIEPGAAVDSNGNPVTEAFVVPVPPDRLPEPLPFGVEMDLVVSLQAPGASNFDVPASFKFPNIGDLAPGEQRLFFSFDHDAGE